VNNIFLDKVRGSKESIGKLGETFTLDSSVLEGMIFLTDMVGEIDSRAASKFGLPQPHTYEKGDTAI
jgi:hypothetical protein